MSTTATTTPQGHYLLFGVDKFQNTKNNLNGCVKDVNYWDDLLKNDYDYHGQRHVYTDSNATLSNFILSMLHLAGTAQAGDVVFIGISTHGTYRSRKLDSLEYQFLTHRTGENCSNGMFNFLLKFFKKDVRINIVFDICHAEGFINYNLDIDLTTAEENLLQSAVSVLPANDQALLKTLMQNNQSLPISASILEFSSVSKDNQASDQGWISKFSKSLFAEYLSYNWWKYRAEKYRDRLEDYFDEHIQDKFLPSFIRGFVGIYENYPDLRRIIENNMNAYNQTATEVVEGLMKHPWVFFIPLLEDTLTEISASSAASKDDDFELVSNFKNYYEIMVNGMPNLHFRGVPDPEFRNQWVFCIEKHAD